MNKKLLALLLIIPLMISCNKPTPEPDPDPEVADEIVLSSPNEFNVAYGGGEVEITFTSNVDWKVACNDSWVQINPSTGTASTSAVTVNVAVEANPDLGGRNTVVYIFAGDAQKDIVIRQDFDPYAGAGTEIVNGATVLANNKFVEQFLTEVTYPDHNYTETYVTNYYGGFNGKTYDAEGNPDPNGTTVTKPVTDKPNEFSIRWTADESAGDLTFHLEEPEWSRDVTVSSGSSYVNFTNLVPGRQYTYSVTGANGKVMAQGSFNTTGHMHQVFFKSAIRNARDLGGWKTYDGKTVKFRKVYRGGRLESGKLTATGIKDLAAEGIKAQLDLRGQSDVLTKPAVEGLAFCAPVIETGGDAMLTTYKDKTRESFQFVIDCIKNDLPVYFHCSLGRDRTGTFAMLVLGLLDVIEGDISKEYEVTYFSPKGYSIAESETYKVFQNTRTKWAYRPAAEYIWENFAKKSDGTYDKFSVGVEKFLLSIGISQSDIDDFRSRMLE